MTPTALPYRRSWVDIILDWIERVPGVLVFYSTLAVATVAVGLVFVAPDRPETSGFISSITFIIVAGTHWLRTVSDRAMTRLRPSLGLDDGAFASLRHRMVYTPPKMALLALLYNAVYVPVYVLTGSDPWGYDKLPTPVLIVAILVWAISESIAVTFVITTLRRIVFISRIHRDIPQVELFRQQPLHGLLAVTGRTGVLILIMFGVFPLVTLGSDAWRDPIWLMSFAGGAVVMVVVTVVPLLGLHGRLVEERRTRAMANGHRIEQATAAIAATVERADGAAVDATQKALALLITERDLIARAPTWPWAPGPVRTLATTTLVPIVLIITGRFVDAWLNS